MLTNDDLKRYSVIVEDGSGCFFQPMTTEYTYILTAKHLFRPEIENEQGQKIKTKKAIGQSIRILQMVYKDVWEEEEIQFKFQPDENYFEHNDADIAILKIPYQEGFNQISVQDYFEKDNGFSLCGFPNTQQNEIEKYGTYKIESFGASNNYGQQAQLFGTLQQDNIEGFSGGGILKISNDTISIIGIQSKMIEAKVQSGGISFVPLRYAKEIISEHKDKLEPLLPLYFKSFSFFKDSIFEITYGFLTQEKVIQLKNILIAKAKEIEHSKLTPIHIKNYIKQEMPSVYNQDKTNLKGKRIWGLWLELLTILNIQKEHKHCVDDFPELLKQVRLFYSNVDADYWISHLHEMHNFDYSGLQQNGLVIVASNTPAADDMHILDLNKIPSSVFKVSKLRNDFELRKLGQSIDEPTVFPFEKFKFINISAFKDGIINHLDDEFKDETIVNCLINLKQLYGKIFSN